MHAAYHWLPHLYKMQLQVTSIKSDTNIWSIYYPGRHLTAASLFTWNPELIPTKLSHPQTVALRHCLSLPARRGVAAGCPVLCRVNVTKQSQTPAEPAVCPCGCTAQPFAGSLCLSCKPAGHKPALNSSCLAVGLWCQAQEMSFFSARPGGLGLASRYHLERVPNTSSGLASLKSLQLSF